MISKSQLKVTTNNPNKYENPYDEMVKVILSEFNGSDNLKDKNLEDLTEEKNGQFDFSTTMGNYQKD